MAEEQFSESTFNDVQVSYQDAKQFLKRSDWNIPRYDWDMDKAVTLDKMPTLEITKHLEKVVAAEYALETLRQNYTDTVSNYIKTFNNETDKNQAQFNKYMYISQNPNKIAYLKTNHLEEIPAEQGIDNGDTATAKKGLILSVILMISAMLIFNFAGNGNQIALLAVLATFLGMILFPVSIVFYILAKLAVPFSQPIALYKNHKIKSLQNSITRADKQYCEANNRYDEELLKKEFKYYDREVAINSLYVNQMAAKQAEATKSLEQSAKLLMAHIGYFPPNDTRNEPHLFRIYRQFFDVRANTWRDATSAVDQSEERQALAKTLIQEMHNASQEIISAIGQMSREIVAAVDRNTEELHNVQDKIEKQTSAINHWGQVQTEIMINQENMMQNAENRAKYYETHHRTRY